MQISVVIPTYNRGAAIQKTVDSALAQDYRAEEFELIVVDDGSTDDTFSILQSLYGADARVRLFSIANVGVAGARNFGLEKARGEFIAYLDHDDLWLPAKLRLQVEVMRHDPQVGVVYCLWREIDDAGRDLGRAPILRHDEWENLPQGAVFARLMRHNFIISMTLPLIRTQLLREVGGFNSEFVPCDDWDVWLKLAQRCDFAAVTEVLVVYVRHSAQQSRAEAKMLQVSQQLLLAHIRKNWRFLMFYPRVLWIAFSILYFAKTRVPFYNQAREAIRERRWRRGYSALCRAWLRHPGIFLTPQWLYVLLRLITRNPTPF